MAATDTFSRYQNDADNPATHAVAITPSNTVDLDTVTRGIYIGVAGNICVDMFGGETAVVFVGLVAGVIYPLRVTRVRSTSTTATSIVGVW